MARTLPWLKESQTVRADIKRDRSVKRQRVADPETDDDELNTTGVSTPKRKAVTRPGEAIVILQV